MISQKNTQSLPKTSLIILVISLLVFAAQSVLADSNPQTQKVTPEFIKSLPPLPETVIRELKRFENFKLAEGQVNLVYRSKDKFGNTDIAYGITADEVDDAKERGFLPENAELPEKMTKSEADEWHANVTLLTYRAVVREIVTVPLTLDQEAGLILFAQNAGKTNLKKLVSGENRLNDGNYDSVISKMPLYYRDADLKTRCEFQLAVYKGKPFKPKT